MRINAVKARQNGKDENETSAKARILRFRSCKKRKRPPQCKEGPFTCGFSLLKSGARTGSAGASGK